MNKHSIFTLVGYVVKVIEEAMKDGLPILEPHQLLLEEEEHFPLTYQYLS